MNAGLRARLALDTLPYGAGRAEVLDAVTAAIEDAHEVGRVEGRLDVLLGETGQIVPS